MIIEDYVSFETAKLLKEKGFDEDITTYRDDFIQHGNIVIPLQECLSKDKIKTPTLQMAMKWLREVHQLYIEIKISKNTFLCGFRVSLSNGRTSCLHANVFSNYEEACEAAIKYCIDNLI